jgi:lipopolysaccharide/colanic/teichoic acid biosynthesis glycosyltransferase
MERIHKNRIIEKGLKRLMDAVAAGIGLILLSPFFLIVALLIKIDSQGPVLYRHKRIGKGGKPFHLLKFRSMQQGKDDGAYVQYLKELIESERLASEFISIGGNGHHPAGKLKEDTKPQPYRKMEGDPRITRVGRILRKFYLDELPQLWNIFIGEMSLVGPRPHVQMEVDYYTEEQCRRLSVSPGLTGLWQVAGKADCTFNELIALDLEYIDRWNIWLDTKIIGRTFLLMARGGEGFWARMAKKIPNQRRNGRGYKLEVDEESEAPVNASLKSEQPESQNL